MKSAMIAAFSLAVLAGCGPKKTAEAPPMIRPGEDACAECGMIINEVKYAAGQRTAAGEEQLFDDIGDMLDHHVAHGVPPAYWVHDHQDGQWIPATAATYVAAADLKTPMGSGLAAFRARADAEAFAAKQNGKAMAWADVQAFRKAFVLEQQNAR